VDLSELGIRPLTARSLVLTVLLGTHPPRLPTRSLVAMGELFGLAGGTIRTALSRMVAGGELRTDDGYYVLGERMRQRQAFQDAGRRSPPESWDGTWWFAIVEAEGRSLSERRAFRARMRHHRMGEFRPDIWLRPANIAGPEPEANVLLTRGPIAERDPASVVNRLWDLDGLAATGRLLAKMVEEGLNRLDTGDPEALPDSFMLSVAVVHFLLTEPQLPPQLVGADWPADRLRSAYDRFEAAHNELLASFLSTVRDNS
jgi:phenylacetic acid degradation operon negative regulatory protein